MTNLTLPPIPRGPSAQLESMKHGESVLVPHGQVSGFRAASKNLGIGIVTRKEGNMTRIWKNDPAPSIEGRDQ